MTIPEAIKWHEEFIEFCDKVCWEDGAYQSAVVALEALKRQNEGRSVVDNAILKKLFNAFPYAIINRLYEFVADPNPRVNSYFSLADCKDELDVKVKVIEWLSREACKSMHYSIESKNKEVHKYHLDGINKLLETEFTEKNMNDIYYMFGNAIRHEDCKYFVSQGCNMQMVYEDIKRAHEEVFGVKEIQNEQ